MRQRRYGSLVGVAAVTALLAGCQGGGAPALSLAGLTRTADAVPREGQASCPLAYDMAEAAKAAGAPGAAAPGSVKAPGAAVATSEGGKRAAPDTPLAQNPGALVSCVFHIGREEVVVHTAATRDPQAVAPLAALVAHLSASSTQDLIAYVDRMAGAEVGEPVVTGSGNVAAVRLRLDGEGDAVMVVGAGDPGRSSLDRDQLTALATSLADQMA
ncbi:hypothetical protein [Streptomyces subrutilus]|uniref:DUF3558 domain-containing protein n=1 Tax=Streptomyces subrutilus TaxID=36818 RepID=A0A5P2ULH3_9ACTN|nr:hypothetical protein [Streptomyces subrutilus]QEU77487.1 hypothetical protein CP968_03570 [Streptomyces subrutilus]WSJ33425.1 hypothetical protein OG479_31275 [Streptomyces subrutilus]GGZ47891.1 hypothetical protein GCM10010371_04060 [Streptomyces subrutilus]